MKNKAHVSLILDKSGSMGPLRQKTISGVNEYFQTLKNDTKTDYTVDLVLFDDYLHKKYTSRPLSEVKPLDNESYYPSGGTALFDAACDTLLTREGGGGKWIVVITTDGEENSSKTHNETQFSDYVKVLKATGNVQFVYLGANQNAFANAQKWNFDKGNVANFNATPRGVEKNFMMVAMNTVASSNLDWSAKDGANGGDFFSPQDQQELEDTK